MKPHLLFYDIDGTLISNKTQILPDSAIDALYKAKENGHKIFVNTGRTISSLPVLIKQFPFDGFLCGCGTRIVYQNQTLFSHSFSKEYGLKLIDWIQEYQIEAVLEGSDDIYFQEASYKHPVMEMIRSLFANQSLGMTANIEARNFIFDKFCFVSDNQQNTEQFLKQIEPLIDYIPRESGMYECVPKGYSKASAMYQISEFLKVPMLHTFAFGDSSNDLTMIQAAAHGIAMGEHTPLLDAHVEYITDTVENDGLYKAMAHFKLI